MNSNWVKVSSIAQGIKADITWKFVWQSIKYLTKISKYAPVLIEVDLRVDFYCKTNKDVEIFVCGTQATITKD